MSEAIRPGYGTSRLHLRQAEHSILSVLGPPEETLPSEGARIYWIYDRGGIECLISLRSHRLLSIFYKSKSSMHASLITDKGITFGSSPDQVVQAYGTPSKQGGGFTLGDGDYVNQWVSYHWE